MHSLFICCYKGCLQKLLIDGRETYVNLREFTFQGSQFIHTKSEGRPNVDYK